MNLTNFEKKLILMALMEYKRQLKDEKARILRTNEPFVNPITCGLIELRLEEIENLHEKIRKLYISQFSS